MTYDTYNLIFIIGAILAGVMLVTALVLFFVLKIPRVIGDLSGSTARKAIADIRSQNTATGVKVHKTSAVNKERGRITDKISGSGRLQPRHDPGNAAAMNTEKLHSRKLAKEAAASAANETVVLEQPAAETTVLPQTAPETTVLGTASPVPQTAPAFSPETTVLPQANAFGAANMPPAYAPTGFTIEYELTFIHSDELIA